MAEFSLGTAALGTAVDLAGLDKGINTAENRAQGGFGRVGNVIGGVLKTGVVLGAAAAVTAVVGIGAAAFGVANEMKSATNNIQADLGTTREEAERLGDVAVQVFKNNFGDSIGEAGEAVSAIRKQLGEMSATELQDATENAFRLRDAYGVGVAESVSAVDTLMIQFGLTQQEAFDFLATGYQKGLDASGDFIDSVGEYSNLFADSGFDADAFFSIMETGLQGGVLGTDKVADAIKEMQIRLSEGGDDVGAAFEAMQMDFDAITQSVRNGDATWADYFPDILSGLQSIEDPIARNQAQVALFGTMAEDLGVSFTDGLSTASTALDSMGGAIDRVDVRYENLGDVVEGFKRRFLVAIAPVGEKLLALANEAMPHVERAFDWMENELPGIIDAVSTAINTMVAFVSGLFKGPLVQGLDTGLGRFQFVRDWIDQNMPLIQQTIQTILTAIKIFWERHGEDIMRVVSNAFQAIATTIEAVLKIVLGIIRAVMLAINGDWAGAWGEIQNVVKIWIEAVGNLLRLALDSYLTLIRSFLSGAGAIWRSAWDGMQASMRNALTGIGTSIRQSLQSAIASVQGFSTSAGAIWRSVWDGMQTSVRNALTGIGASIRQSLQSASSTIRNFGTSARTAWSAAWRGMQTAAMNLLINIQTTISSRIQQIVNAIMNLRYQFQSAGRALINAIGQGIREAFISLYNEFLEKAEQLRNLLPGSEPKDPRSPLRGLAGAGEALIENIQAGINGAQLRIDAAVPDLDSALAVSPSGSLAGAGPSYQIAIEQNFHGPADRAVVQGAAEDGIRAALRRQGRV